MEERALLVDRSAAAEPLVTSAGHYEHAFGIKFHKFAVFTQGQLERLHRRDGGDEFGTMASSASGNNELSTLTAIANRKPLVEADRRQYLRALLDAYSSIAPAFRSDPTCLVVAPRREGMYLARELGWLRSGHATPDMKRIPFEGGLTVGISEFRVLPRNYESCEIVDGAIASGATVMTLMELLHPTVARFDVFTAHATTSSVEALHRYARYLDRDVTVRAAYVSGCLNDEYYAVDPNRPDQVIVGDLGDMIAPILC